MGTFGSPFTFTGEQTDANGLVYLRARYYHPGLGVFLSQDPLEGEVPQPLSLNRYMYVQGNPVNRVDPSGMIMESPGTWDSCRQSEQDCPEEKIGIIQSRYPFGGNMQYDVIRKQDDEGWLSYAQPLFGINFGASQGGPQFVEHGDQIMTAEHGATIGLCRLYGFGRMGGPGRVTIPPHSVVGVEDHGRSVSFWGIAIQPPESDTVGQYPIYDHLEYIKRMSYDLLNDQIRPYERPYAYIGATSLLQFTDYQWISHAVEAHPQFQLIHQRVRLEGQNVRLEPYDQAVVHGHWSLSSNVENCSFSFEQAVDLVFTGLGIPSSATSGAISCAGGIGLFYFDLLNEGTPVEEAADLLSQTATGTGCLETLFNAAGRAFIPGVSNAAAGAAVARILTEACPMSGY